MSARAIASTTMALLLGCSSVDVALEHADGGDSGPASTAADLTTTTDASSSVGEASATRAPPSSSEDGGGSSTGTADTSDSVDASTEDGTTGGLEGSPCNAEQEVCALVELDGVPSGFCGETLELIGITQPRAGGGWTLQDCGACELCGGPEYTIDILAPAGWAPAVLPLCSRIAIDYAPMDATPWACAFVGMAVWGNDGLGEDPAPVYVASSITATPPTMLEGLTVDAANVAPEMCPRSGCCFLEPGKYTFTLTGAGLGEPLTLAEHDEVLAVDLFSRTYAARNVRSHGHKECGRIPHFDWVLLR